MSAAQSREYERPSKTYTRAWPGYFDDPDGTCRCSWSYLRGVRQVKYAHGDCPVRHERRAR